MPEELEPVEWWVWKRADPSKRGRHTAVTRLAVLLDVSTRNKLGIELLDAEVVREGDQAKGRKAAA